MALSSSKMLKNSLSFISSSCKYSRCMSTSSTAANPVAAPSSPAADRSSVDLAKNPPPENQNLTTSNTDRGVSTRRRRPRDALSSLIPAGLFDLWSPLSGSRSMKQMMNNMNRIFDSDMLAPIVEGRLPWDIAETEAAYHVRIDMPGLEKSDLNVHVEGDELVIKGEKSGNDGVFENQRSFSTAMLLPPEANKEEIKAELKNGVLTVIVPKKQASEQEKKQQTITVE